MAVPVQANVRMKPLYINVFNETRPFYTSGDKVRGVLRVEPTLRPQRISLTFKGFSVIYDQTSHGASPTLFIQEKEIFQSPGAHENFDILKKGTAADGKVELPFEFEFPRTVDSAPPSYRAWRWIGDDMQQPRFQYSPGFPLPPSCLTLVNANKALAPKVVYALEASLESVVPDTPRLKIRQELKFIPPAPDYDLRLLQPLVELGTNLPKHTSRYKLIRTRKLLPGYVSSSKLAKLKDVLVEKELFFGLASYAEVPFAKFNILASPARVQVIGSAIPIVLSVQHLDRSSSVPDPPEIFMRRLRVQLLSTFHIFVPRLATSSHRENETVEVSKDTLTLADRKFNDGRGHLLHDGWNLAVMEDIQLAHEKLIPSFTSYGLALEYELQVEVWGECAGSEFSGIVCREGVQVVSGWTANGPPGPSLAVGLDDRPEYHEMDSAARHELEGTGPRRWLPDDAPEYDADYTGPPVQPAAPRPMPPPYMA